MTIDTFAKYEQQARNTAIYTTQGFLGLSYTALGLTGEAGEVAEKIKKLIRDGAGKDVEQLIQEKRFEIAKEIGDVLWYVSALCRELGVSMEEVACLNIDKLHSRKNRNKIQGSGDNR